MNKIKFLALITLMLAPLLRASRTLPGVPRFGKLRVGSFQPLENYGAMTSNAWN